MNKKIALTVVITTFALGLISIVGAKPAAKPVDVLKQGQALADGMVAYKEDGTAKMTVEGPAAKVFYVKMSDDRITSRQPTDECQQAIIKSGDHMECGHCVERVKRTNDVGTYWCVLNFEMEYGKVLGNSLFAPSGR